MVDPRAFKGFDEGVSRHAGVLVGTGVTAAAASTLILSDVLAVEFGSELLAAGPSALHSIGEAVFVQTARVGAWFTELSLAEQGLVVGGGGGGGIVLNEARGLKSLGGGGNSISPARIDLHRQRVVAKDILLEANEIQKRKLIDPNLLVALKKLEERSLKPLATREDLSRLAGVARRQLRRAMEAAGVWLQFLRDYPEE